MAPHLAAKAGSDELDGAGAAAVDCCAGTCLLTGVPHIGPHLAAKAASHVP